MIKKLTSLIVNQHFTCSIYFVRVRIAKVKRLHKPWTSSTWVDRVVRPYETGRQGRRPLQRDVKDAVPYEKPSYLSAGCVACVLPAKVGNSLVKEGGIRYNHIRNCTGKGDASMYGIGQQAVHPVHGAGITEGVPEELPHEAAVMTGVCE